MFQQDLTKSAARSDWPDYVVAQGWESFSKDDHAVWDLLFERQSDLLGTRVVSAFLDGIDLLRLSHPGIPELGELNAILEPRTGWRTVAVPGLVPDAIFFSMLATRIFPIGNFIRTREQLDYLEAPDCFHDLFGHIPMLAHHQFAEMVEHIGRLGLAAVAAGKPTVLRSSIGTVSNSGWRASVVSFASSAPASPRVLAKRISASKAKTSNDCPSPSSGRSTRLTATTLFSRATWCRSRWKPQLLTY